MELNVLFIIAAIVVVVAGIIWLSLRETKNPPNIFQAPADDTVISVDPVYIEPIVAAAPVKKRKAAAKKKKISKKK